MKFKFKTLVPNEHAKAIIEAYENAGYNLYRNEQFTEKEEWNDYSYYLYLYFEKENATVHIPIPKFLFKEKEPLKLGVWYDREDFDENPKGYGLIENTEDGGLEMYTGGNAKSLLSYSTRFMYFELPEKEES